MESPSKLIATSTCNLDTGLLHALVPLFQTASVEALEWSFDALYKHTEIPPWFHELLHTFSKSQRLIGHGVYFSIFLAAWSPHQKRWLEALQQLCREYRFDHLSEHFGFMTGNDFHKGAPMPVPLSKTTLAIGRDRLHRISDHCGCPVGLENLAFAFSLEDVKEHGSFLDQLVTDVSGFIILDLHNIYCTMHNFEVPFETLIVLYPLDKVREIHISGGSWQRTETKPSKVVRRDTHDEAVPKVVFELLEKTLPLCPNLKYVTLEQMGSSLMDAQSQAQYRLDFSTMKQILEQYQRPNFGEESLKDFMSKLGKSDALPLEDPLLYKQQMELSFILENATSVADATAQLGSSILRESDWKIEQWPPYMVETAMAIAQKWKNGFV